MKNLVQCITLAANKDVPDVDRCNAFNKVVHQFQDMAFGYALSLLGDRYLAEDAAQEGFITAWENLGSLQTPAAFPGWFRRIVQWQCQRFRRGYQPVFTALQEDMPSKIDDPSVTIEREDERRMINEAIRALPETLREVTLLHYMSGYKTAEIARFLDLPASTVRKRLFDARRKLKDILLQTLEDEMADQVPSKDQTFGDNVMKWIRPDFNTDQGNFMGGRPDLVWEMLIAAVEGDVKKVKALLKKDAGLASCNWAYFHPINLAVREGHTDVVRILLDHDADPTSSSGLDYQVPPLERARDQGLDEIVDLLRHAIEKRYKAPPVGQEICDMARQGNMKKITALIDTQPDLVNSGDELGNRPLHIAVEENNQVLTELLISRGADLHAVRWDGFQPLHVATYSWKGRPNPLLAGYLIARGAEYGINVAAALGDEHRVKTLLAEDRNQANEQGTCQRSPLSSAAKSGHIDIIKLLLDHGADPNAAEYNAPKGLALYEAAAENRLDIVKLLLEHGAEPNPPVESSGNPLTQALGRHKNKEMVDLLYNHGASAGIGLYILMDNVQVVGELLAAKPELANDGGDYGSLCMAARFSSIEMIEMLIRAGADLNRPWYANNYMGYAFSRYKGWSVGSSNLIPHTDYIDVFNLFFEHGADPNLANWHGVTYLHKLAGIGDIEKAGIFLDHGADINAVDDEWRSTPLGWAARNGHKNMVKHLLDHGADRQAGGAEWATPLARAEKAGHKDIVKMLR